LAVAVAVRVVTAARPGLAPAAGAVSDTVGTAAATVTLTADDVIVVPLESVTRAVNETLPVEVGVHVTVNGAELEVPRRVVPAKKSTLVTVAGATGVAVAVRDVETPRVTTAPESGFERATVGALLVTVTLTMPEVATTPLESVTRAVSAAAPVALGTQVAVAAKLETADVGMWVATTAPPTRKSTRLTVAPPVVVAVAARVWVVLSPTDAPLAGLVIEIEGREAATVTLTTEDVTAPELESVTRAVKAKLPAAVGVQFTL
jgi:hypothetical protein